MPTDVTEKQIVCEVLIKGQAKPITFRLPANKLRSYFEEIERKDDRFARLGWQEEGGLWIDPKEIAYFYWYAELEVSPLNLSGADNIEAMRQTMAQTMAETMARRSKT